MRSLILAACAALALFFLPFISGCGGGNGDKTNEVVIYTSIDEPIARPILQAFEKQTGIHVIVQTDTESAKSVGLAARLIAEKSNPQADVWWGNEVFYTIHLARNGVLQPYDSPAAADIPDRYKDPGHLWTGVGLRARVMAVNTQLTGPQAAHPPTRLEDLADPIWKNKLTMAFPTAGTTGGYVATLQLLWGKEKAGRYFQALHDNGIHLVGGNSIVADSVGQGLFLAGLTDNDDVTAAQANNLNVKIVLPDQEPGGIGTLVIPSGVGLIAGAKHPAAAKKLIDYLLSAKVEQQLIDIHYSIASVRDGSGKIKTMNVDYNQVAKIMPQAKQQATRILEGRK